MPSSTSVKVEAKPPAELPDLAKQCLNCLEKKVRNLEKRKSRIEINKDKASKGTKLEKEAEISLEQYAQVSHDLEFARELHKQFLSIHQEHEKMVKKQAKREKVERQAAEIKKMGEILHLQSTLDLLGGPDVREDFKSGKHGAVVLTEDNLDQLDALYQAISPSREEGSGDYAQQLTTAAEHLVNTLDGKDRQVLGTTYKELKELLNLINDCGYFERVSQAKSDEVSEVTAEVTEEPTEEAEEESPEESEVGTELESSPEPQQQQQPIDLTVPNTEVSSPPEDIVPPQQPLNTVEQDAFFAPNSTAAFEEGSDNSYPPVYGTAQQNYESFTNNRPFQFIQTSYVMPEDASTAPSVVDPAVIHAQPAAAGSGLAFMSQPGSFEPAIPSAQSSQPVAPSAPQVPAATLSGLESRPQPPPPAAPAPALPQPSQPDFSSQAFSQSSLQQKMQPDGLFNPSAVEEVQSGLSSRSGIMSQMREDSSNPHYDIPPSIPMPSSQSQDQSQLDQQQQEEKKFQMNASAPAFQSMYSPQVGASQSGQVPPPTVPDAPVSGDFNNGAAVTAAGDYNQAYQGNGFNNNYSGRGRGGFRGSRGSGPSNSRNGSSGQIQNGFGNRSSPNQNNSRGGGRGGFQSYQQNNYRGDNYQNSYSSGGGGFGKYQNSRGGGISSNGGSGGNNGYQRSGPGGSGGRGGGMRGGMQRGGAGGPRGGSRGGFNRAPPQPQQ